MNVAYAKFIEWIRDNHEDKVIDFLDSLIPSNLANAREVVDAMSEVTIPRNAEGKFKVEIVGVEYGYPLIEYLQETYGDDITEIVIYQEDRFKALAIWRYIEYFDHLNVRIVNDSYLNYKENRRSHVVINMMCQDMTDILIMREYYEFPERTLLVLQSRDKGKNPAKSCQDLAYKNQISELYGAWKRLYSGTPNKCIQYTMLGKWL